MNEVPVLAYRILHRAGDLHPFSIRSCGFEPGEEVRLVEDYIREMNAFRDACNMAHAIRCLMEETADSIKKLRTTKQGLEELGKKHGGGKAWHESGARMIDLDIAGFKADNEILSGMRVEVRRAATLHYGESARAAALLEAAGKSLPKLVHHPVTGKLVMDRYMEDLMADLEVDF